MPKKKAHKSTRRTKRKPKYLSLRLQFSSDKPRIPSTDHMPSSSSGDHHHQLDLFPLHPEEKENHDENMAYLLSTSDGGDTTLTGLLTESSSVDIDKTGDHELSPSDSVNYIRYGHGIEAVNLVRTAFRSRERDRSEERYVRYSEVVERRDEEVSSCVGGDVRRVNQVLKPRRLSLKLDYQEIMSAWSDKSPLYIQSDFAQMVPDINDEFFSHDISSGLNGAYGNHGGGLWRVPEGNGGSEPDFQIKMEVPRWTGARDEEDGEQWRCKVGGEREASVLRYKEKRRNRLFAKTIRYEVRKQNAEKRPRIKGRFVKRG